MRPNQILFLIFSPVIAAALAAAAVGDFVRDFRKTYKDLGQ